MEGSHGLWPRLMLDVLEDMQLRLQGQQRMGQVLSHRGCGPRPPSFLDSCGQTIDQWLRKRSLNRPNGNAGEAHFRRAPMAPPNLTATSGEHRWHERREPYFKIESGESVIQNHCGRCGRDIVTVLSSGARHAAYASAFCFYRLAREVTQRWLTEPCPGERLPTDNEDRNRFFYRGAP
jgi:hypothetical protein